jgi:hypothetical protein
VEMVRVCASLHPGASFRHPLAYGLYLGRMRFACVVPSLVVCVYMYVCVSVNECVRVCAL